jgi:GNAT superfamily N-acetyltransferase
MDLSARVLNEGDVAALQELLESQPEYAEQLTGFPPGPSDALSALLSVPPDFDPRRKCALGLWEGNALVAFADVLLGYPDPRTAYVGLLIVHGQHQRMGLGRRLQEAVDSLVADEPGLERLQSGVISTTNGASEPFWVAMGYRPTHKQKPYRYARVVGTVRLWERVVRNTSADQ